MPFSKGVLAIIAFSALILSSTAIVASNKLGVSAQQNVQSAMTPHAIQPSPSPVPSPTSSPVIIQPQPELFCVPTTQIVRVGNTVSFNLLSNFGHQSNPGWSAPGGTPNSGVGLSFSTQYSQPGNYLVRATEVLARSRNIVATCEVVVHPVVVPPPSIPPVVINTNVTNSTSNFSTSFSFPSVTVNSCTGQNSCSGSATATANATAR